MIESKNTKPWFRDDLVKILIGINLASRGSMTTDDRSDSFRQGFTLALASVAIVIGVPPELIFQSDDLAILHPHQYQDNST